MLNINGGVGYNGWGAELSGVVVRGERFEVKMEREQGVR